MDTSPKGSRAGALLIGLALAGTVCVGAWLRWVLAGRIGLALDFAHVRHAHSHLGYFGVLFPLAWLGWRVAGAEGPGRRTLGVYALATALSFAGFLRAGYGPEAIVGSTVVGAIWLASAWRLRSRMGSPFGSDPLAVVLPGVVLALACVPPIAMNVRRDPATAHAFVATFLSVLLLAVIVPSALAARRVAAGPWPVLLVSAALGAAALGIWPGWPARLGLAVYGGLLAVVAARGALPLHLRLAWGAVAAGLAALAVGLLPNVRPVAIGAIHFLVLGPSLGSLAAGWLRRDPPAWAWMIGHALVGTMAAAIAAPALGAGAWTLTAAAAAGTAVVAWWVAVIAGQLDGGITRAGTV